MSQPQHHHPPILDRHKDTLFQGQLYVDVVLEMQPSVDLIDEESNVDIIPDANLFTVLSAQKWLKQANARPVPQMLFGELWFESELCIMFADTNLGKSILAVQIGNSISSGIAISGFRLQARKQPILYFDFELSDKQFEARYSLNYSYHYEFDDNFLRAEIDPNCLLPDSFKTFEDFLNYSLECAIVEHGAKVLIIDNLTYLRNETERAKDALPLMKHLKALKSKYGLSILCLAHTPKRDLSKPITRNDLQGSKMLINFCDACFAIGESTQDKQVRYIKQIKERNTPKLYGDDNVIVCQVTKPLNFLQFEFLAYGNEQEHLRQQTEQDKANRLNDALHMKKQGLSNVTIAQKLNVSEGAVRKWLKKDEATKKP